MYRLLTPCYCHFFDRKVIYFFSRTTHVYIPLLRRNVLFMMYNCPSQQDPQISRQLNTYGTWWIGNLFFLQSLPQPLPNFENEYKMLGTIFPRMTFGTLWLFACVPARGGYSVYWYDCLGTPYCDVCFIWSKCVIIYSYNDKLHVASIFNTMNLYLKVLHFFR